MRIRLKILLVFFIVILATALTFSLVLYKTHKESLLQGIDQKLLVAAYSVGEILPENYHDKITSRHSVPKDEYLEIVDSYNKLCLKLKLQYIWSVLEFKGKIVFTSGTSTSKNVKNRDHALFFDVHSNPEAFDEALKTMSVTYSTFHNEWGEGRMVLIPAYDKRGRKFVFGSSINLDEVNYLLHRTAMNSLFVTLLVMGIAVLASYLLSISFSRPIIEVTNLAKAIAEGDLLKRVNIGGSIEMESLSRSINAMADAIRNKIAEIQRSREDIAITLNSIGDAVIATDPEGKVTRMNPVAVSLTGWNEEEVLGRPLKDVFNIHNADSGEKASDPVEDVLDRGEVTTLGMNTVLIGKDGVERRISDSGAPIRSVSGEIVGVVIVFRDVTEKFKQESERRRLIDILESTSDLVATATPEGHFTYMNKAGRRMLQWLEDDSLLDKMITEAHPDWAGQSVLEKGIPEAVKNGIWEGETVIVNQKGEEIPVSQVIMSHKSAKGELQFLSSIIRDISERKRTELELKSLRDFLGNVINSMPSILVGVDKEERITHWNLKAEEITGRLFADAVGKLLGEVLPFMTDRMEMVDKTIGESTLNREEKIQVNEGDQRLYYDVTVYPLISSELEGAVVRIDDVTERVRMEEMMIQSAKMLSVGGLAAGMAHEINNPLAAIMQNAQLIEGRIRDKVDANLKAARESNISLDAVNEYLEKRHIFEHLKYLRAAGSRAARIVENMLSFSRSGAADLSSNSLTEILDKTLELIENDFNLSQKYDFKKIKITREYEENFPVVCCESSRMQQVFLNLLKNGAQSMAEKRENDFKPEFILRLRSIDNKTVRIEIEDNGPGIDEVTRQRIFEPFFTTREVGEGTGLGLAVSYFIITETHNGDMTVEAELGKGTKFIITLPIDGK